MAVAENSDIAGFDDLNGKKVAVKTASMSADYAESIKDQYGFEITYFEDSPTMYQAVVGGQVAACSMIPRSWQATSRIPVLP